MKIVLVLFFVFSFKLCYVQETRIKSPVDFVKNKIDSFPENFQVSIALIKNDKVGYIGFQKINGKLKQISNHDSIFEIGSITKVFTGTLLANMVNKGKIKLHGKVHKQLGFKLFKNKKLRYIHLANHTAGLESLPSNILDLANNNPEKPYDQYTDSLFVYHLKNELQIKNKPGTAHEYSNLGTSIIGYAISKMENKSYSELYQKEIFEKYGLNDTKCHSNRDKMVRGINHQGEFVPNWDFGPMFPCGGITSNTKDLAKFLIAHFDSTNLDLKLACTPTFKVTGNFKIGLSWHIFNIPKLGKMIFHNGATGGYRSSTAFMPKFKTGVVVLSNISAYSAYAAEIDEICFDIINRITKPLKNN
ncbi:MAG: serine hydrolase [Crocinitomicaceae bacterium]|nr:serine hydrolase [Crocinitomicaceae bacterium]